MVASNINKTKVLLATVEDWVVHMVLLRFRDLKIAPIVFVCLLCVSKCRSSCALCQPLMPPEKNLFLASNDSHLIHSGMKNAGALGVEGSLIELVYVVRVPCFSLLIPLLGYGGDTTEWVRLLLKRVRLYLPNWDN